MSPTVRGARLLDPPRRQARGPRPGPPAGSPVLPGPTIPGSAVRARPVLGPEHLDAGRGDPQQAPHRRPSTGTTRVADRDRQRRQRQPEPVRFATAGRCGTAARVGQGRTRRFVARPLAPRCRPWGRDVDAEAAGDGSPDGCRSGPQGTYATGEDPDFGGLRP